MIVLLLIVNTMDDSIEIPYRHWLISPCWNLGGQCLSVVDIHNLYRLLIHKTSFQFPTQVWIVLWVRKVPNHSFSPSSHFIIYASFTIIGTNILGE